MMTSVTPKFELDLISSDLTSLEYIRYEKSIRGHVGSKEHEQDICC